MRLFYQMSLLVMTTTLLSACVEEGTYCSNVGHTHAYYTNVPASQTTNTYRVVQTAPAPTTVVSYHHHVMPPSTVQVVQTPPAPSAMQVVETSPAPSAVQVTQTPPAPPSAAPGETTVTTAAPTSAVASAQTTVTPSAPMMASAGTQTTMTQAAPPA